MFKSYFITAFRNLLRQKGYSFINIGGLAIGLTAFLFIFLWIQDELSYDQFHQDKEQIFEVMDNQTYSDGKTYTFDAVPGLLAEAIRQEVPEVEHAATVNWDQKYNITIGDQNYEENGFYAESDFFKIFDFKIKQGNHTNPLPDVSSIVISEKLSRKLFGEGDALGKVLRVDNKLDLKITAVFEDAPQNSSLKFDLVIPYKIYFETQHWLSQWQNNGVRCYVKLNASSSRDLVDQKIKGMAKKRIPEATAEFWLQPFIEQHLYSKFENGKSVGGLIQYVNIFAIVSAFILFIACINYMNLSTARSMKRAKEIGLRKTVGATRFSVIIQFLAESIMTSVVSTLIALGIVQLLLPLFNELTNKKIDSIYENPTFLLSLVTITFFTGLVAGSYPAFFLSSFKPAVVLKGNLVATTRGAFLRKILVVSQFTISIILIASSVIVYNQLDYIQKKDLGITKEDILYFQTPESVQQNITSYKTQLHELKGVKGVSICSQVPLNLGGATTLANWPGKNDGDNILLTILYIDSDFVSVFNSEVVDGRNFSGLPADSTSVLLSQEAVTRLGLKNPVGAVIEWDEGHKLSVIGIIKDFHSKSLDKSIEPIILFPNHHRGMGASFQSGTTFVKIDQSQSDQTIADITDYYKKTDPKSVFKYGFLSDWYDKQYSTEKITGRLALCFTFIAILISSLGLFGLAAFTAEKRTKEIGIRKVMGASVSGLVMMLSRAYFNLVAISIIIGCPIAYYAMDKFLETYAYHTTIRWEVFGLTALTILVITIATVAYQSIRAATANPTSSLRSE